jgi:hypothetical protein
MGIPVYDGLLLELELARIFSTALDTHGSVVITINFTKYNVVYGSGDLAPLKGLSILKLQGEDTNRIELNRPPPKLPLEIGISPEFPASSLTVTSNYHRVVTYLKKRLVKHHIKNKEKSQINFYLNDIQHI